MLLYETFALGNDELHSWLHEQDDVRFLPVHLVNDPSLIARNRNLLSINGALAVDLHGQIAADTIDDVFAAAFTPGTVRPLRSRPRLVESQVARGATRSAV